jgi:hypothetical protein
MGEGDKEGRKERVSQSDIVTGAYTHVVNCIGCPVNEITFFPWVKGKSIPVTGRGGP